MAVKTLDARGDRCPVPILKMSQMLMKKQVTAGDVLEVRANCPSFEKDARAWCDIWRKVMVRLTTEGGEQLAVIQI